MYMDQTVDDVLAENPGARIIDTKYYAHGVPRTIFEETYTAVRTLAPLRCLLLPRPSTRQPRT